jgi:hypothetical protein
MFGIIPCTVILPFAMFGIIPYFMYVDVKETEIESLCKAVNTLQQ